MIDFDDLDTNPMEAVSKEQLKEEEIRKNAHIVNGGEATFKCPACHGRGTFVSYTGREGIYTIKYVALNKINEFLDEELPVDFDQNVKSNQDFLIKESELPYPPVVTFIDTDDKVHRIGAHEYTTADRPDGGIVTISTYIGDHKWIEAELDPKAALILAALILSKPCVKELVNGNNNKY